MLQIKFQFYAHKNFNSISISNFNCVTRPSPKNKSKIYIYINFQKYILLLFKFSQKCKFYIVFVLFFLVCFYLFIYYYFFSGTTSRPFWGYTDTENEPCKSQKIVVHLGIWSKSLKFKEKTVAYLWEHTSWP